MKKLKKKIKKILVILPNIQYGGTELVLIDILNFLSKKGFQVYLHTNISNSNLSLKKKLDNQIILTKSKSNFFLDTLNCYLILRKNNIKTIFSLQSSIINAFLIKTFSLKKLELISRISTNISSQYQASSLIVKIKLKVFSYCLSKSDTIIVQSKNMKQDLINFLQICRINLKSKIKLIYNPLIISEIYKLSQVKLINIPKRDYFLFLGRLEKVKFL